jgi:hypothetical protein
MAERQKLNDLAKDKNLSKKNKKVLPEKDKKKLEVASFQSSI